jgi:TolB-like protein/Flp pilus assembly protein TadD
MTEQTEQGKIEIGHVLVMDVVGYSRLLIDEQSRVIGELNRIVRGTVRFRVAQAAGKLISWPTGDGMALVFFGDPAAALECAMEIAVALKAHPQIRLRMGTHSGPVNRVTDVNEGSNVAGAGIDMAQRVMDCGDAGHILLSRRVAYDLAPSPRWSAHLYELGDYEVKHGQKISLVNFHTPEIGNPEVPAKIKRARAEALAREKRIAGLPRPLAGAIGVLLALILSAGLFFFQQYLKKIAAGPLPPPAPEKSIAVLPFTDLSQAKDQEYFCDGISEEILDALARIEGLRVVARTSSFSFRGTNADTNEIGRKLNVATVLEGSLRRDGGRIRISAQLINARDGFHLWSQTFEKELQGVFAVQDEITRNIVDALKIKLAMAPAARAVQNTEAYDLYLKGLYFSNKSSEEDLRISLAFFEKALEKDPKLGRAWTGIAKDWLWLADAYVKPLDAYPKALVAANNALALNDRDAEAHAYLGEMKRVLFYDLKGEEIELQKALEIDPNSAVAHLFLALLRNSQGETAAGLEHMQAAVRLDPLSPIIGNWEVDAYVANDRLDEAFAAAKRTMEIDPDYVYFEPDLAMVYREQGKLKEALDIYERLEKTRKQPTAGLAITYARLGRVEEARRVLTKLVKLAETRYFPGEQIASVYVALGDKEAAFYWIERAITEHSGPVHSLGCAPEFRALRSDPRFPDVLRRIGLDSGKVLGERQKRF